MSTGGLPGRFLAIDEERAEEDEFPEGAPREITEDDDLAAAEAMVEQWEEDHPPWAQRGPEREPVLFHIHVTLKDQWSHSMKRPGPVTPHDHK